MTNILSCSVSGWEVTPGPLCLSLHWLAHSTLALFHLLLAENGHVAFVVRMSRNIVAGVEQHNTIVMKVLFFANKMPDLCGAFLHDVDLALELKRRGHQVAFMVFKMPREGPQGGTYRDFPYRHFTAGSQFLDESHVWLCPHAPVLPDVRKLNAKGYNRPIIATCHYDGNYNTLSKNVSTSWSEALCFINGLMGDNYKKNIVPWPASIKRTEVIRPIMHYEKIYIPETFTPEYITLVNANENKGVRQFIDLARRMPDRKFLGVLPYYGELRVPAATSNVTWIPFDDDIRNILKKTRILLMPSFSESFGRVAVEAMVNGIPVLYTRPSPPPPNTYVASTEGVAEWIGEAGIQCDRDRPEEWEEQIQKLDDENEYAARSLTVTAHIGAMNLFSEASRISAIVEEFAATYPAPVRSTSSSSTSVAPPTGPPVARLREPVGPVVLSSLLGLRRTRR